VSFPLLSDPESEIIERFGILNTLVETDDHPWFGIPFPGTYVVNADGIITAKFFESNLALRANSDQLRRAALGEEIVIDSAPPSEEVTVEVMFDGDSLAVGVVRDLLIRLGVPEGQHLYGEPVPNGMVATSIEMDESVGVIVLDPQLPPTHPHTLQGTGEELQIFDGDVLIRIPITHNQRSTVERDDGSRVVPISGTVRWQSCDDEICNLPATYRFELDVPAVGSNVPAVRPKEGSTRMDFRKHFSAMKHRHDEPKQETSECGS
jgi:DsbC/DsbD-like thiol-disulfide interchange protein